ncbi:MAG TPA: hypothetical protein VIF88_11305 [Methylocystis sp.]|jgi:hypothetical protein
MSDRELEALRERLRSGTGGAVARPHAFLEIVYKGDTSQEILWRLLHLEWSGFADVPYSRFESILRFLRPHWRADYMPAKDRAFFESLPDKIEVWRGQDDSRPMRLAWTTNEETARAFARGRGLFVNSSPVLYRGVVARRHVALAPQDRDEEAIVIFAARHIRRLTKTKLLAARSGEERAPAELDQAEGRAP